MKIFFNIGKKSFLFVFSSILFLQAADSASLVESKELEEIVESSNSALVSEVKAQTNVYTSDGLSILETGEEVLSNFLKTLDEAVGNEEKFNFLQTMDTTMLTKIMKAVLDNNMQEHVMTLVKKIGCEKLEKVMSAILKEDVSKIATLAKNEELVQYVISRIDKEKAANTIVTVIKTAAGSVGVPLPLIDFAYYALKFGALKILNHAKKKLDEVRTGEKRFKDENNLAHFMAQKNSKGGVKFAAHICDPVIWKQINAQKLTPYEILIENKNKELKNLEIATTSRKTKKINKKIEKTESICQLLREKGLDYLNVKSEIESPVLSLDLQEDNLQNAVLKAVA